MEKQSSTEDAEKGAEKKKYPIYHKCDGMMVRQDSELDLFYVEVAGFKDGGYRHHRGRTVFPSAEWLHKYLEGLQAKPSSQEDYLDMMKDYFAMDKDMRNKFLMRYGL